MSEERILLVDDDPANRLTLAALLEEEGFAVEAFATVPDARAHLETPREYALAVLDLHIGAELGTSLVEGIRAQCPRAKIVVLSGTGHLERDAAGIDDFLEKGLDPTVLLAKLAQLSGRT